MNPSLLQPNHQPSRSLQRGFTLIEVMIVVAIVAILSAIAIPSYRDYVIRGRITTATNALSALRANMERHFQDNKTYQTFTTATVPAVTYQSPCSAASLTTLNASLSSDHFTMTCPTLTAAEFVLSIAGSGPVNGFVFTLDNHGAMTSTGTTGAATGWGTSTTRWCIKRGC